MDDSTWLNGKKQQLESTLNVTRSFNQLNDIQVNDEKGVLITTNILANNQPVTLHLADKDLHIIPLQKDKTTRILGV